MTPTLCAKDAEVIWTRGTSAGGADLTRQIRRWFDESGFDEVSFEAPAGATYRVGVHRLVSPPRPFEPGRRLFTFIR